MAFPENLVELLHQLNGLIPHKTEAKFLELRDDIEEIGGDLHDLVSGSDHNGEPAEPADPAEPAAPSETVETATPVVPGE